MGNGGDCRSDDPFAQRFSSLYLPFDRCSLPAAWARTDRRGRLEHPGLARIDLAPRQPPAVDDCFTWRCGDAVFCPRRSLDFCSGRAWRELLAAAIWFFGIANAPGLLHRRRPKSSRLAAQAIISGAITAIAMMIFATLIMPRIDSANKRRPREVAGAIRAALPAGAQLWVLEDSYRPFWYYLEPDVRYFHRPGGSPGAGALHPAAGDRDEELLQDPVWQNAPPPGSCRSSTTRTGRSISSGETPIASSATPDSCLLSPVL